LRPQHLQRDAADRQIRLRGRIICHFRRGGLSQAEALLIGGQRLGWRLADFLVITLAVGTGSSDLSETVFP